MSSTPNLLLAHIVASQNQKEVTANASADGLDEAMNSNVQITMVNADYTFATGAGCVFLSNMFFQFIGANSAARNVNLPPNAKLFVVQDSTTPAPSSTQGLTFKVGTHVQSVTISDGNPHLLYSDGVGSVYQIS